MDTTSRLIDYLLLKGELARARDPNLRASLQQCVDQARHKLADASVAMGQARQHAMYRTRMGSGASSYPKTGRMLSTRS